MRHVSNLIVCLIALIGIAAPAPAQALTDQQRATILEEAQDAYDRGVAVRRDDPVLARRRFAEAAVRFQQLADDGIVNGALHYNLANAYLQSDAIGSAILHYRVAETLIAGDAALQHNLEYARTLRRNQIEPAGSRVLANALLGWHSGTSTVTRAALFTLSYLVWWCLLLVHLYRPSPLWKWTAVAAAVLSIGLGVSVARDVTADRGTEVAVILVDDVVVRKGNGIGFEPQFLESLFEGVECTVIEQRPGWLQIELPDGKLGWIQRDQAGLVADVLPTDDSPIEGS